MNKKNRSLSKNQKLVLDFIQRNKKPVKAYSILSNVQKKGIKAPPQVYRALDKLIEMGKIHKIYRPQKTQDYSQQISLHYYL